MADGSNARKRVSGWRAVFTDGHTADYLMAMLRGTEVFRFTTSLMTIAKATTITGAVIASSTLTATGAFVASSTAAITGLLTSAGGLRSTSPTVPIGYSAGAGAAKVTQLTNRSTGVAVTTVTGQIQTDTTSLAAEASAIFVVTATGLVTATDVVIVSQVSGSNGGNTDLTVYAVAADQFSIRVSNNNAAAGTAETGAIVMNFAIIKGAIT